MRCESAREHFSDYCDGSMLYAARIPLESHLGDCERCRQELDDLKRVWQVLDRMPSIEPPAGLRAVVWQRIDAAEQAKTASRGLHLAPLNWRALFAPRTLAWAAAALVAVVLAGVAIPGRYQQAWLGYFSDLGIVRDTPVLSRVAAATPTVKALGDEQEVTIPLLYRGGPISVSVRLLGEGERVSPASIQLGSGEPVLVVVRIPAASLRAPVRLQVIPVGDPHHAQMLTVPLP